MFRFPSWKDILATVVAVLITTLHSSTILAAEEYIRIDNYVSQHSGQSAVMAEFAEIVRASAEPITAVPESPVRIAIIYPGLQASDY